MTCRYCRKPEDDCAADHDEDVFDEESYRRRIQIRRPIAIVDPPREPERRER